MTWSTFWDSLADHTCLQESSRAVTYKEGAEMARKLQTLFVECSAKTNVGVKEAFEELVTKVRTSMMYVTT